MIGTPWKTDDIWLRREFTVPANANSSADLQLLVFHDEDVQIYIDGVQAARRRGFVTDYQAMQINGKARSLLKPGAKIVLAVHCHQTQGGQGIDVGIANIEEK